jgi:hypothetical protein
MISYRANFNEANPLGSAFSGGNDIALQLMAIPEPGTWATLMSGLGMLMGLQRFRRRS